MLGLIFHEKTKIKLNSHLSESDRSEILLNFIGPQALPHPSKLPQNSRDPEMKNKKLPNQT